MYQSFLSVCCGDIRMALLAVINGRSEVDNPFFDMGIVLRLLRRIKPMGYSQIVRGHVDSIARAINVPNAQANQQGLATVNPIFTWVRLAQRIPVRIHIDEVPEGVVLSAGMTATVQIDPRPRPFGVGGSKGMVNLSIGDPPSQRERRIEDAITSRFSRARPLVERLET
jgi:hypothetical protein